MRPGEKILLDGRVVRGTSGVDQAPITGESVPVNKEQGDEVFAGTINGDGLLEIESTKSADDTTLAHIIKMVGDASSRRAPSEKWVEKFAAVYTPMVMVAALAVLIIPPLVFDADWSVWLYRALVLLVIACPCALVISTPVSVVASLASAARNGVLVKGGVFIEIPATLRAIAMDKTGTLTKGAPEVIDVVPLNGHDETELLTRAGALELNTNHPLARAIVEETRKRGIKISLAEQFEIIQGKGASGKIDETRETVRQLHNLGVEHIVMLTGDNERTAKAIATQAGIDEVHAELLPEDKVAAVEKLVAKYKIVAMIGDGVSYCKKSLTRLNQTYEAADHRRRSEDSGLPPQRIDREQFRC